MMLNRARQNSRNHGPFGPRGRLLAVPLALAVLLVVACTAAPGDVSTTASPAAVATSSPSPVEFDAGGAGWAMAATPDALWVQVDPPVDSIVRIDKGSGEAVPMVPGGWRVRSGEEGLWVTCCDWLAKIDTATGEELLRIPHGGILAVADGAAWLYTESGDLLEVDAENGAVRTTATIDPAECAEAKDLLVAFGSAWLACKEGAVVRIDLAAGNSTSLTTPAGTHTFAATDDAIWVTNYVAGSVTRIEPESGALTEIEGAGSGIGITIGGGFVWAADSRGIAQIDPEANQIIGRMDLGKDRLYDLIWDDGVIWATTATNAVLKVDAP